jgi:hypothetical protein
VTRLRHALAHALLALAELIDLPEPYFPEDEDDELLTPAKWAGLMVLHAEAIHGCQHTDDARRELGMSGPRGVPA